MAAFTNMEQITLIDADTNETYVLQLNSVDAERARNDIQFATKLLENAKQSSISNSSNLSNENTTNEPTKSTDQHIWTKQETMLLIDTYKLKEKDFHNGKTVKHCWEIIAKEMEKMGHNISGHKCSIKFQAMKRTYKSIKDSNKKTGNSSTKWEYFEIMDDIFSEKPWVEPLSVAETSCDNDSSSTKETCEKFAKKRKPKKKTSEEKYLEKLLEEKRLKREADDRKHNEKMQQFEALKGLLQKFIEKEWVNFLFCYP